MKPERARLRDGTEVLIRQIRPDDRFLLRLGFEGLSAQSRTARFLAPKVALSNAEVAYFTEVDHVDHEALVAADPGEERGLGVARYVRSDDDPRRAEMAVVVVDELQGTGLATLLLEHLARRARRAGILHFDARVLPSNRRMVELARKLWQVERVRTRRGVTEISLSLERPRWWRRLFPGRTMSRLW
jgi:GNAT superfamily N-acetyltransferase